MTHENVQIRLVSRPEGRPRASDFETTREPAAEPADGEVLVRNVYLSLDPAMRGWMSDRKSYVPPVGLGEVMRGLTVGEVVDSRHPGFSPGDGVAGLLGWQLYAATKGKYLQKLPPELDMKLALGPLGMTGMTAYFGLFDIGRPQAGDTVLVSAAAGATGSMVGQLAKIHGCRIVGLAGRDDKCRWIVDDLGFDGAINYKSADVAAEVERLCPSGLDIYFDNVGGEILDIALRNLRRGARVVICGAISQYNATEPVPGPSHYLSLLVNRARMEGFLVLDYEKRYPEAQQAIGRWIAEGKIHWREDVVEGLENAPEALLRLFDGKNVGKLMVRLGPEP